VHTQELTKRKRLSILYLSPGGCQVGQGTQGKISATWYAFLLDIVIGTRFSHSLTGSPWKYILLPKEAVKKLLDGLTDWGVLD